MYHLFMATPEKVVFDGQVESLVAPGKLGYLEILTNHAAIITTLKTGRLQITDSEGKKTLWALSGGYLDVLHNEATLLADTIELGEEIDLKLAETALERAKERLASSEEEVDKLRAKKAYERAENRIQVFHEASKKTYI